MKLDKENPSKKRSLATINSDIDEAYYKLSDMVFEALRKKQYKTINIYDVKQSCDAIDTRQNTDAISLSIKDEIKILELETSESVSNENISSNTTSDFYYLPQSDNLYFTCPQNISSVNIINAHGQTCSKKGYPNRYMALKYLQPGIYIIHCQLSNGNIISKRIIK